MSNDGIDNIIYLGYYELTGKLDNLNQAVSVGNNWLDLACESTVANCIYVDPRGKIPEWQVESDNVHPTPAGSANLASQIWPVLEPLL